MSLKSFVKVSHLSNLSDARYCAGMGVEMLGFGVVPGHKHYMPPDLFQDIRGWISGPAIVAEVYGVSSPDQIDNILRTYSPDFLEMGLEEYQLLGNVFTLPCLVYLPEKKLPKILDDSRISRLIVDEHATCREIRGAEIPVLSKVTSLEKLNQRLSDGCFQGYVLEGPQQVSPGLTNYDELGIILEALEE